MRNNEVLVNPRNDIQNGRTVTLSNWYRKNRRAGVYGRALARYLCYKGQEEDTAGLLAFLQGQEATDIGTGFRK
jgi:hypothetical protein